MADQEKDIKGVIENSANNQSNAPAVKEELIGRHDRKKTISLIRYVLQKMEDKKTPYVPLHYTLIALYNSLELLSDQEPRVMTLEEVKASIGEPIYFESRGTYMGKDGFWILPALFTPSGLMRYVHPLSSHYSELGLYSYGKSWRCWTSRPTDEQRKAVKWE